MSGKSCYVDRPYHTGGAYYGDWSDEELDDVESTREALDLEESIRQIDAYSRKNLAELGKHTRTVLIYGGKGARREGVDMTSAIGLEEKIRRWGLPNWTVSKVEQDDLLSRMLFLDPKETICVLPGGAASEYERVLQEHIPLLRTFNEAGSPVVAVCGPSFLTAGESLYKMGPDNVLEKKRRWTLFPGTAIGPQYPVDWVKRFGYPDAGYFPPYEHRVAKLRLHSHEIVGDMIVSGGGRYIPDNLDPDEEIETLLTYGDTEEIAAVRITSPTKEQGNRVMMMPHPEFDPETLERELKTNEFFARATGSSFSDLEQLRREDPEFRKTRSFNDLVMTEAMKGTLPKEKLNSTDY